MSEDYEQTLLVLKECFVYRIGPRPNAAGYKAQDWDVTAFIWSGRLVMIEKGENCSIRFEDPNSGEVFALCPVDATSVEPVIDSSRYFVVRIRDPSGRHAFVGMGFTDRSDAFDFNAAVQDYLKQKKNEAEQANAAQKLSSQPKVDYSLHGSIRVNLTGAVKPPPSSSSAPKAQIQLGGGGGLLPPPPKGRTSVKQQAGHSSPQQSDLFQATPQQQQQQQSAFGGFNTATSPQPQHQQSNVFGGFNNATSPQPQHNNNNAFGGFNTSASTQQSNVFGGFNTSPQPQHQQNAFFGAQQQPQQQQQQYDPFGVFAGATTQPAKPQAQASSSFDWLN